MHLFLTENTLGASYTLLSTLGLISYATGILGRFASKFDVKAIEKLFGYLNTIKDYGLVFTHCENHIVEIKI